MATLYLSNFFSVVSQGTELSGKQGASTDDPSTAFALTVDGTKIGRTGQIATATAAQIFSSTELSAWDYLHFWADQDVYLQLIGSAGNVVLPVEAKVPIVLSRSTVKAVANTTAITGGAEPVPETIAAIYLGNYSGSTASYALALVT